MFQKATTKLTNMTAARWELPPSVHLDFLSYTDKRITSLQGWCYHAITLMSKFINQDFKFTFPIIHFITIHEYSHNFNFRSLYLATACRGFCPPAKFWIWQLFIWLGLCCDFSRAPSSYFRQLYFRQDGRGWWSVGMVLAHGWHIHLTWQQDY